MACYQMGPNTHSIPMTLFRENRDRVMAELRKIPALEGKQALVVLQGGDNISLYDTDVDYVFRQVRTIQLIMLPFQLRLFYSNECYQHSRSHKVSHNNVAVGTLLR